MSVDLADARTVANCQESRSDANPPGDKGKCPHGGKKSEMGYDVEVRIKVETGNASFRLQSPGKVAA